MSALDRVTAALEAVGSSQQGRDWTCPAHEDRQASLSVSNGNGRVLVHCHAGCSAEDVVAAVRLTLADLFDEPTASGNGRREIRATYDYVDERGELLYQAVRLEPKAFRQRRPDGNGGWTWKLADVRRVLYQLPLVLDAVRTGATVYLVEGEKDVHAIETAGAFATCNAMGAGKWRSEYSETLRGADVVIVADRDEAGIKHARQVAGMLTGVAANVRVVEALAGKDAADHLAAGHTLDDFQPAEITAGELAPPAPAQHAVCEVTFDEKGKLMPPELPAHDDVAGQCKWLTGVFSLNPAHPITGGAWQGLRGPDGQIALRRAGAARDLRFEPAKAINTPMRLIECFTGRKHTGDGMLHALKGEHCRQIAHVIECLCDTTAALSEEQEAVGVVGTFLGAAVAVEGLTTYGASGQRYEAAVAMQRALDDMSGRPIGPPRYLVDKETGELVIRVEDLAVAARAHTGSGLARGWLDARVEAIGWARIRLAGYSLPGRDGRRNGAHARCGAYRGQLPLDPDDTQPVNT